MNQWRGPYGTLVKEQEEKPGYSPVDQGYQG